MLAHDRLRSLSSISGVLTILLVGALSVAHAQEAPSARDTASVLAGTLIDVADSQPVPYGTVWLVESGNARFANAQGRFRFTGIGPGTYTVHARQIGYAPIDTAVRVESDSVTRVAIAMRRLPPVLQLVHVRARRSNLCIATGIPDSSVNPTLFGVFRQLRENVDRFRLLVDKYPFRYSREERVAVSRDPGGDSTESLDTLTYDSRDRRPYNPGDVIYSELDSVETPVYRRVEVTDRTSSAHQSPNGDTAQRLITGLALAEQTRRYMYLPTFRDLSDSVFLAAHCFEYGGMVPAPGTERPKLLHIDFRPASRIRTPDVEGSVYLDATNFLVRRAVFRMSKPQTATPPLLGLTVSTTFRQLVPFVPVFDSVSSDQPLPPGHATRFMSGAAPGTPGSEVIETVVRHRAETDRLLASTFERIAPGEQTPHDSATASSIATRTGSPSPRADSAESNASGAFMVHGRVVGPDGAPVPNATVGLFGSPDTALTSDSGAFTFAVHRAGAHTLWVRQLGFETVHVTATLGRRPLVVVLRQRIPTLAKVTTTATRRTGSSEVGLTRRMRAGVGQFLTPDQIAHRHATSVSHLLMGIRGIRVWNDPLEFEATVEGTRGVGSCVSFVIDGAPTTVASSHDLDNLIEPSAIGAIEVYSSAERPSGMGGLEERTTSDMEQPPSKVDFHGQQCTLVVIWSRSRLGLDDNGPSGSPIARESLTRVQPLVSDTSRCDLPPSNDSVAAPLYAALESNAVPVGHDTAWPSYLGRVLGAIRRTYVPPSVLPVLTIGAPFAMRESGAADTAQVAPMVSSVVVFTIDSAGEVHGLHMAASSLSGPADTSLLAAIADASDAHAIPVPPARDPHSRPLRFDLTLATGNPMSGERATLLGTLLLPTWPLRRAAALTPGPQPSFTGDPTPTRVGSDSATFEFVVDERGHVVRSTIRAVAASLVAGNDSLRTFIDRSARVLAGLEFKPAIVASCPVRQLIRTNFNRARVIGPLMLDGPEP